MVYPVAPVYLSEISPLENRAFLVGLKGLMNTLGFFAAEWDRALWKFCYGRLCTTRSATEATSCF
ncbi:hypothetical protein MCOR25_000977 [Pyricularia grisea]|nr:hypothetical protein MCOR25_000977 [Pyricularia grisea]